VSRCWKLGVRFTAAAAIGAASLGIMTHAAGAAPCPNTLMRSGPSSSLADCRAYELVSPPTKNGADVLTDTARTRAARDGGALQFASLTGFDGSRGGGIAFEYMSVRNGKAGTSGWRTHGITPPQEPLDFNDVLTNGLEPRFVGDFSADLNSGVFLAKSPVTAQGPDVQGVVNLYVRDNLRSESGASFELLSNCPGCASPFAANNGVFPWVAGASADYGTILFESRFKLTLDAPGNCGTITFFNTGACPAKLYEWDHGTVRLEGILPDGSAASGSVAGRGAGAQAPLNATFYTPGVISRDGSRVVFTSPPSFDGSGSIYMRANNATTVQVNASERTDCSGDPSCGGDGVPTATPDPGGAQPAMYWAATADDGEIFFTTAEQLTDDDTDATTDLYRYDVASSGGHHLVRLASGVDAVVGTSTDGSYVYFQSGSTVSVWHDGGVHVVAVGLTGGDQAAVAGSATWLIDPNRASARVAPDGTKAVLELAASGLTGYDNSDPSGGVVCSFSVAGCREVYLFDATANGGDGQLICMSCNVSERAASDAGFSARVASGGANTTSHLNHPLADNGRFAFFDTADPLVPADVNGKRDVYEYDAVTKGVHLISSGHSNSDSFFLEASSEGKDVFFATREQLVGWDVDQNVDVYDARIDGGVPGPVVAPSCSGDGCRVASNPAPLPASPGSAGLSGVHGSRAGHAGVLAVGGLKRAQLRAWGRSGHVRMRVRTPDAGQVRIVVRARLGRSSRTIATAQKYVPAGGVVAMRVGLSKAARSYLARHGRLRVRILVAYSGRGRAQVKRVTLIRTVSSMRSARGVQ
jgi:hypothetical protein